jgi:hypothetical protein
MHNLLNQRIICEDIPITTKQTVMGTDTENGHVVVRTSHNEQLMYLDAACEGHSPVYLGIVKSRGNQQHKEPVQSNDFVGGFQVYARVKEGNSLGYNNNETPLCGAFHFVVGENYNGGSVPTELLIALGDEHSLRVTTHISSHGDITTVGNLQTGNFRITDEVVSAGEFVKAVKVILDGVEYCLPLYSIQGKS